MKKVVSFLLAAVFAVALPCASFAWGKKGHGMVAEIAFALLDSNTKQKVQQYLGTTTIEQASNWMDDMRSDHSYDYMKPWHYVNIEKGSQYVATTEPNLVNALNKAIDALEHKDNLSNEEIKKNLMIIFHLVGDMHMPLHVGYASDKGGNDIQVNYLGHGSNLHRVWDTDMIESENISVNDCLARMKRYSMNEIAAFKKIDVVEWIHEPRSLLYNVYDFKNSDIDQAYVNKNKPIVEDQILIAGIRLSAVLSDVFKS